MTHVVMVSVLVKLVFQQLQFFDVVLVDFWLVSNQLKNNNLNILLTYFKFVIFISYLHVEVGSKCNKNEENRNYEACCNPGSKMWLEGVEFHPTQYTYFNCNKRSIISLSMVTIKTYLKTAIFQAQYWRPRRAPRW